MADDFLALTPVDPISIAFPGRQTLSVAQDAGLTATDIRNGLNQTARRVTALESAPPPVASAQNYIATHVVADWVADYDFLFAGAPASLPKSARFFNATGGAYGNRSLDVIGDEVWGTFTGVNSSRPVTVTGGIERINGGLRFKTGAVWSLDGGAVEVDPFSGQNLTIAASF